MVSLEGWIEMREFLLVPGAVVFALISTWIFNAIISGPDMEVAETMMVFTFFMVVEMRFGKKECKHD